MNFFFGGPSSKKPKDDDKTSRFDSVRKRRKKGSQTDKKEAKSRETTSSKQEGLSMIKGSKSKALQVKPFVEETLNKGVQGLVAEFRKMKRFNDYTKMTEFVAQNALGRNRYKDVGCLDSTRVSISLGPVSYIHANYVATIANPKKFICTQAPLPATCADFWYMIVQEKTSTILMLCNFFEMGTNKCAPYFPATPNADPVEFDDGNIRVVNKSQEPMKFSCGSSVKLIVSQLEVVLKSGVVHQCSHMHWQDWPDRGVPAADLAPITLLASINKENTTPIVVHCSAGIGRTGSVVLIQQALDILQGNMVLQEMATYMEELRKQRNNSVQTEQQYLYVHQVMFLHLRKMGYLDSSIQPYLDNFAKDYVKATT